MKYILLIILYLISYSVLNANLYIENNTLWYKTRLIKYEVWSEDYNFKIWVNKDNESTSFRDLLDSNNWISWVNWVFFCPKSYSDCWWVDSTKNERYYEWISYNKTDTTWDRAVFAVDDEWTPFFYKTGKINPNREGDIYYWFWNFPLILYQWKDLIPSYDHYWLLDNKMKIKLSRNFICTNQYNNEIIFWYIDNISLYNISPVLKDIWCYNALNLDAWWSSSMIYNWRDIIWPWRNIMDGIIIERKWLDTSKLIKTSDLVVKNIDKKLKNKSFEEKIEYIDSFKKQLTKLRTELYDKNSKNTYDKYWNINWYQINMNSINNLSTVYIINRLNLELSKLKNIYIEKNKIELDKKNLLF